MRAQSKKRRAEKTRRDAVVAEATARDRGCIMAACLRLDVILVAVTEANIPCQPIPRECGGPLDAHEVIPRTAWPGGHLVLDNVVMICRRHHDWVGDNLNAAAALGLHGYSWQRPEDTNVKVYRA